MNEAFEKVSSYGLLPNMIFYLMNVYHLDAAKGTIILSLWSALSNAMAIFGGFLSDSYLGRFRVIAFGTFCSLLVSSLLASSNSCFRIFSFGFVTFNELDRVKTIHRTLVICSSFWLSWSSDTESVGTSVSNVVMVISRTLPICTNLAEL